MHQVKIRQEIIDRVMARRGRVRWFDRLDPAKTALVSVDMQSTFCAPGGPAGPIDIMFGPSGAVITPVSVGNLNLWVRCPDPVNYNDPFRGQPSIISVFVKTGLVGAFPPALPPFGPNGPYALVY